MDDKNEYFKCDCVYHRKGYILCENCIKWINEDSKNDDGFIKVKRWSRYETEDNKHDLRTRSKTTKGQC